MHSQRFILSTVQGSGCKITPRKRYVLNRAFFVPEKKEQSQRDSLNGGLQTDYHMHEIFKNYRRRLGCSEELQSWSSDLHSFVFKTQASADLFQLDFTLKTIHGCLAIVPSKPSEWESNPTLCDFCAVLQLTEPWRT